MNAIQVFILGVFVMGPILAILVLWNRLLLDFARRAGLRRALAGAEVILAVMIAGIGNLLGVFKAESYSHVSLKTGLGTHDLEPLIISLDSDQVDFFKREDELQNKEFLVQMVERIEYVCLAGNSKPSFPTK
jgi:hypothetical protein